MVGEAVRRSGLDTALIDDVVLSESRHGGGDIARYAAIEAGLTTSPGWPTTATARAGWPR